MKAALFEIAKHVELGLDAIAVLLVAIGALHTCVEIVKALASRKSFTADKRGLYIHFAQWLVAALTFQLAADIVSTTIAPDWEDIGRVAAIALIRTFLTFFLDRDLERAQETRLNPPGDAHEKRL
jgi:uncharacterized membrane protein